MACISSKGVYAGCCAAVLILSVGATGTKAQYKEKVLYSFAGGSDGADPSGGLIADSQGNLYGVTWNGGGSGCGGFGCGTVYRLTPQGAETVLNAFAGDSDGNGPTGMLIVDTQGNLYGTTSQGGDDNCIAGCGTVFRLTPEGEKTVLYAFKGGSDGGRPVVGSLILDSQGDLYGATQAGGTGCRKFSCGTVFELTPQGVETVLHAFAGKYDGAPYAGLIADSQGNLYGTTWYGRHSSNCNKYSCGTIFEVTPQGDETVLYSFADRRDGAVPLGVIADAQGNLYGVTAEGGNKDCNTVGCGTVFEVTPQGTKTVLHTFKIERGGWNPSGPLLADAQGNLYGTTSGGGSGCRYCGTVFEVTPQGTTTVLYAFKGNNDGIAPSGGLVADGQGNLYGTTQAGGTAGHGTIFELEKSP